MNKITDKKTTAKWIIGIVSACIILFLGLQNIEKVLSVVSYIADLISPLIAGIAIAAIFNVPMRFFESVLWPKTTKKLLIKIRRPLAFVISLLIVVVIVSGIIWLVIPELFSALRIVVDGSINLIKELSAMDSKQISDLPFGELLLKINWKDILNSIQNWLTKQSGTIINTAMGTIGSIFGGIFDIFVSVVFAVYILFSKSKLKEQACRVINAWLSEKRGKYIIHAASVANVNFRNFVAGQSLEAVILGTLCMIGMFILRIPYAPMVGALVGVTAIVPVVGAFIGAAVGAFMILTVDPVKAVIFIVFLIILQQVEGNIIYPKVMGNKVNLPGMWILVAVTIGGGLGGAIGMLLSVPIAATLYVLFREATQKKEQQKTNLSDNN